MFRESEILNVRTFLLFALSATFFVLLICLQTSYPQLNLSSWSSATEMLTPRSEVTATGANGSILVIGGFDISGRALDVVEIYSVYNDSWKTVAPLPQPLHHTSASIYSGKVFVVGGFTSDAGEWIPSNRLFIYDIKTNEWSQGKPMPTARGALISQFVDGILFAIGGQQSSDIESSQILNTNEAYDPVSDTWTTKKPMPTPRHHSASSVVDGKIYVIGGRTVAGSSLVNLNLNEMYNPKTDEWMSLQSMPTKRSGISAASYNNSIFVFGGEDAGGMAPKTYSTNEEFSPFRNSWTSKQPLPTPRHGLTATTVDDQIYVIGGGPRAGLSVSSANEVFDPNGNSDDSLEKTRISSSKQGPSYSKLHG